MSIHTEHGKDNPAPQLTYIFLRYLGIDDSAHGDTKTEEKRVNNT